MKQQTPINDDLVGDLRKIIDDSLHQCSTRALRDAEVRLDHISSAKLHLMEKLVIHIVNRDGKVLMHGINIGKELNVKSK